MNGELTISIDLYDSASNVAKRFGRILTTDSAQLTLSEVLGIVSGVSFALITDEDALRSTSNFILLRKPSWWARCQLTINSSSFQLVKSSTREIASLIPYSLRRRRFCERVLD
jgi:hypothetical protein